MSEPHVAYHFFCPHARPKEPQHIGASRVPYARVHQVSHPRGMIVISLVPAENSGNMVIRLDCDPAPAPRPLARSRPDSVLVLPGVFRFAASSLTRTDIGPSLPIKSTNRRMACATVQLNAVIPFLVHAPPVEFVQRAPLMSRISCLPVVRDTSIPFGGGRVDGTRASNSNTWMIKSTAVRRFSEVNYAKTGFETRGSCWGRAWRSGAQAEDRKH